MQTRENERSISEQIPHEIFAALIDIQESGISLHQSRESVAERYDLPYSQIAKIEREGVLNNWPPL